MSHSTQRFYNHALWLVTVGLCLGALSACGEDTGQPKKPTRIVDTPDVTDGGDMTDMTEDIAPDLPDPPVQPKTLQTVLSPTIVDAGSNVTVECQPLDAQGEVIAPMFLPVEAKYLINMSPLEALERQMDQTFQAQKAGQVAVYCASNPLGLIDDSPAILTVNPGPAHTVITRVDTRKITAGESVEVACDVFDAFGNKIENPTTTIATSPMGSGVIVNGAQVTVEKSGIYTLSCQVDGAMETKSHELEVNPSLPANLVLARVPDQNVYGLGQTIEVVATVTDPFNNIIPNPPLAYTTMPDGNTFGAGRFRYDTEGLKTVEVTVTGPTHNNAILVDSVQMLINGTGPAIDCVSPADGEMVTAAPGSVRKVRGKLSDTNGFSSLTINGAPVAINSNGEYELDVPVRYGINFLDITAEDNFQAQNSRTCAFLVSDRWAAENQFVDGAISLKLNQQAVDDNNRNDGIDSLNDILHIVLNSQGLRDSLHQALLASNPLKDSCDQRVFGACVFRSKITYLNSVIDGPNDTSLELVNNGLRLRATVRNVKVQTRVNASLGINTTGWADLDSATVDLTSDLKLVNGKPSITLRRINDVQVGGINLRFSGLTGLIIDVLELFFRNTLRNQLRDLIRDYIQQEFNALLDGIVSGLDVSSLGTEFDVPRLDGNGDLKVGFGVRFSDLLVSSSRALFGIGSRFSAPILRGGNTKGAPMPSGTVLLDPTTNKAVGAGIHVAVLNQVIHTLWRGGYFDATIGGATLSSSLPMGTEVTLSTNLPPVVVLVSNKKVKLHLGAINLSVIYPGLFDDPLEVTLGAVANTTVTLVNGALSFGNIVIEELYFSTRDVSLDETTRDVLESFLKTLLQNVVDTSLNNALPSLPIPSFELPASLATFGLPPGAKLGLKQPTITNNTRHFILDGNFGVQ